MVLNRIVFLGKNSFQHCFEQGFKKQITFAAEKLLKRFLKRETI